tara:strand:- start:1482 stop:2429 length:948 start_codon:yes stop_codon:yes gene_type:complete
MPIAEFPLFSSKKRRFTLLTGMGASYFTRQFDTLTNPGNQAVTTKLTWSFRVFFKYRFLESRRIDWQLGAGFFHHSNGHTRLPNQGLNSFLGSLSAEIKHGKREQQTTTPSFQRSRYHYLTARFGYGINVLSNAYNDQKPVYTVSGEYGQVLNNTYRIGIGFYYRYYDHYYEYINNHEFLVREGQEFSDLRDNPFLNASAIGLHLNGELLLNHIGIELQLGANLFKPSYRFDWRINEGWDNTPREIPDYWVLGEYTSKFKMKHLLSARLGLKYYLFGTHTLQPHNLYFGAHINANGGQADFTEFTLGYVYSFPKQ